MPPSADQIWEMEAAKGGEQGEWENCPPGNYPSNVVGLFDIGTHTEFNKDKNENYDVRQLVLVLELQKKDSKGKNFFMAKKFTWSMRDNSNWYKLVSALTGTKFADGQKYDPRKLVGMPCMAMVTETTGTNKKGKTTTYANLETISQYPDGFPLPAGYRPPLCWSVSEGTPLPDVAWVPNVYGKSLQKLVEECKEFSPVHGSKTPVNTTTAASAAQLIDNPISVASQNVAVQNAAIAAAGDSIPF
jgi:hypothetical protein